MNVKEVDLMELLKLLMLLFKIGENLKRVTIPIKIKRLKKHSINVENSFLALIKIDKNINIKDNVNSNIKKKKIKKTNGCFL